MRRLLLSKRAVTLVELISSMGLATIMVGVPSVAFKASIDASAKGQITSEMVGDIRIASTWLARDVHNAEAVTHLSAERLDVALSQIRDVRYTIDNGTLKRSVFDGGNLTAEESILDDVDTLSFKARSDLKELIPDINQFPDTGLDPNDLDDLEIVSSFITLNRQGNVYQLRTTARFSVEEEGTGGTSDAVLNFDLNRVYSTLQAAIDDPDLADGMTLRVREMTFKEDVTTSKSFRIVGGWNSDFTERPAGSFTLLDGSFTINDGAKVKMKWFKII